MQNILNQQNTDFLKIVKNSRWNWLKTGKKKREKKFNRYLTIIIFVLAFVLLSVFLFIAINFFRLKSVYSNVIDGKNNINTAVFLVKNKKFQEAKVVSEKGSNNFSAALIKWQEIKNNPIIKNVPFLLYQFDNTENLLVAAKILSHSVVQASSFASEIDLLVSGEKANNYSNFTIEEKKNVLSRIHKSSPDLIGIKANLDLALINLNQTKCSGFLWLFCGKITDLKEKVSYGSAMLDKAIPLSQMVPAIFGYPAKSTFLVLLQNQDELRPTGGFLGTYGILEVEYGEILRFDTHDIYHLDMPVKDKLSIVPPAPLGKYLNTTKWFMRDSNWSPDWPSSAKTIDNFYHQEDSLLTDKNKINNFSDKFVGIIGITPKFITDLLNITGPVVIEGQEYNKNNFSQLLEYRVEKGYAVAGESSWQRKEVIGEIAKQIKIRLMDMPASRWQEILGIVDDNFLQKDVIVYFADDDLETIAKDQGWAGNIKWTDSDYIMLVDANLGAYKTDSVIDRSLQYNLSEKNNELNAKIVANYAHQGGYDWRTTKYRTYSRIYVPKGSKLLRSEGQEGIVDIGEEQNKTYFGAFIEVQPGQIKSWSIEYKLPNYVEDSIKNNHYSLLIQKQPGKKTDDLQVNLSFANVFKSFNPTGFNVNKISKNEIFWKNDLSVDRYYKIKF